MKPETRYRCEKCETLYLEQEEAEKCENSHVKPVRITDACYLRNKRYPEQITIEFETGYQLFFKKV